jgi:hypothetical protein
MPDEIIQIKGYSNVMRDRTNDTSEEVWVSISEKIFRLKYEQILNTDQLSAFGLP